MPLGLILGLGRAMRRKRTSSLSILSSKRGPRDYYKGKNCKSTGFHTRKGDLPYYFKQLLNCPFSVISANCCFLLSFYYTRAIFFFVLLFMEYFTFLIYLLDHHCVFWDTFLLNGSWGFILLIKIHANRLIYFRFLSDWDPSNNYHSKFLYHTTTLIMCENATFWGRWVCHSGWKVAAVYRPRFDRF